MLNRGYDSSSYCVAVPAFAQAVHLSLDSSRYNCFFVAFVAALSLSHTGWLVPVVAEAEAG